MTGGITIAECVADLLRSLAEDGTDIVLTWNTWPANTPLDPVTQARLGPPTAATSTLKAFVHFVNLAQTSYVRFNEIKTGDVILDFAPDADLDGKEDLRFNVAGKLYVQKAVGDELAECWDALVGGQKFLRSVLLRKAT